jgi:hypothetical protein
MSSGWMRSAPSGSVFRHAGVRKIWFALCMRRCPATSVNGGGIGLPGSSASQSAPAQRVWWSGAARAEDLVALVRRRRSPPAGEQLLEGTADRRLMVVPRERGPRPCFIAVHGSLRKAALFAPSGSVGPSVVSSTGASGTSRSREHLARLSPSAAARRPAASWRAPRRREDAYGAGPRSRPGASPSG